MYSRDNIIDVYLLYARGFFYQDGHLLLLLLFDMKKGA